MTASRQNLRQWAALSHGRAPVALTVGPWMHGPDLVFKAAATLMTEALEWVDTHLAGASPTRDARVHLQLRGDKRWRSLPDWPPQAKSLKLFLTGHGVMVSQPATAGRSDADRATTAFTYDPRRPTPALGGA
jgi:predicted acyl esterase